MVSEFEVTGRYVSFSVPVKIYGITPDNKLNYISTLQAGSIYPIKVYDIINGYLRFKVSDDAGSLYPGSNYTLIPFNLSTLTAHEKPYNVIPEQSNISKFGDYFKLIALLGASAYVLGAYFGKKN